MKKKEELFSALGSIDEDLILEAAPNQKAHTNNIWFRYVAAAACVALLVGLGIGLWPEKPGPDIFVPTLTAPTPSASVSSEIVPPTSPTGITPPTSPVNPGPSVNIDRICISKDMEELLFAGDPDTVKDSAPSNSSSGPQPFLDNTVTMRVQSVLPDTYRRFGSFHNADFRLFEMETVTDLGDVEMPQKFLLLVPEIYYTDFSKYDYILIYRLEQLFCEGAVFKNTSTGSAEAFDLPVFSPVNNNYNCYHVYAFTDGVLDLSMWQSTEHWQNWFAILEDTKDHSGKWYMNHIQQRDTTLEEAEAIFADAVSSIYDGGYDYQSITYLTNQEALDALAYVKPFENGIFAYTPTDYPLGLFEDSIELEYVRYLNDFPTNESIEISHRGAKYSHARFEPSDTENLPELGKALAAVSSEFHAGRIKPPHLKETADVKLLGYAITGKFMKCKSGVYGLVTVRWHYEPVEDAGYRLVDECYYLIAPGENSCRLVTAQEIIALFGDYAPEIYRGQYDELGRKEREYIVCY